MAVRLRLSQNWARRGGAAVPFLSVGGSDADTSLNISVQTAPGTLFQGAGDPSLGCQSALPKYPLSPTSSSCSRAPMPPTPPDDSNAQSRPTERPTQPPSTAGRAPLKSQQHAQDRAPDRANHDPIECLLSDPSGEPTRVVVNPNSRARPKANPISSSSSNSSASPATSPIHPPSRSGRSSGVCASNCGSVFRTLAPAGFYRGALRYAGSAVGREGAPVHNMRLRPSRSTGGCALPRMRRNRSAAKPPCVGIILKHR